MKKWWRRIRKLLKWTALAVIVLWGLNLGNFIQIRWPNWLQWEIKLPFQVKIEQQDKPYNRNTQRGKEGDVTFAPTVSPKMSSTLEPTTVSEIADKTPEPINKVENFPLDVWVPKYTEEPTNTPIPVPTIKPTPKVPSSIQTIYLTQGYLERVINEETVKIDSWVIKRNKETIEIQGKEALFQTELSKLQLNWLIENKITNLQIPYATISLYTLFSQTEETGTEKVLLKWYLAESNYHLKAIFRRDNFFLDWLTSLGRERSITIK